MPKFLNHIIAVVLVPAILMEAGASGLVYGEAPSKLHEGRGTPHALSFGSEALSTASLVAEHSELTHQPRIGKVAEGRKGSPLLFAAVPPAASSRDNQSALEIIRTLDLRVQQAIRLGNLLSAEQLVVQTLEFLVSHFQERGIAGYVPKLVKTDCDLIAVLLRQQPSAADRALALYEKIVSALDSSPIHGLQLVKSTRTKLTKYGLDILAAQRPVSESPLEPTITKQPETRSPLVQRHKIRNFETQRHEREVEGQEIKFSAAHRNPSQNKRANSESSPPAAPAKHSRSRTERAA